MTPKSPAPKPVKAEIVRKMLGRLVLGTDQVRIVRQYVEALEADHKVMREAMEWEPCLCTSKEDRCHKCVMTDKVLSSLKFQ